MTVRDDWHNEKDLHLAGLGSLIHTTFIHFPPFFLLILSKKHLWLCLAVFFLCVIGFAIRNFLNLAISIAISAVALLGSTWPNWILSVWLVGIIGYWFLEVSHLSTHNLTAGCVCSISNVVSCAVGLTSWNFNRSLHVNYLCDNVHRVALIRFIWALARCLAIFLSCTPRQDDCQSSQWNS